MERKEKMQDRERGEDAGWREEKMQDGENGKDGKKGAKGEDEEKGEKCRREKKKRSKRAKKIYPFGCNINYFSYICTRKGIIISNVYL